MQNHRRSSQDTQRVKSKRKHSSDMRTSNYLFLQILGEMLKVVFHERSDEVIAVIVALKTTHLVDSCTYSAIHRSLS